MTGREMPHGHSALQHPRPGEGNQGKHAARTWNLNGQQNLVYKDVSGEHSPDPKGSTGGQEPETSVRRLIFRCRCGTRKSGPPTS